MIFDLDKFKPAEVDLLRRMESAVSLITDFQNDPILEPKFRDETRNQIRASITDLRIAERRIVEHRFEGYNISLDELMTIIAELLK